jgi:hypothetical protein
MEYKDIEQFSYELQFHATMVGSDFADFLIRMKDSGDLKEHLPEIDIMDQFDHTPKHHPEGNVWEHTLSALRSYKGSHPYVNLGILFHDVGKPPKHFVDENGSHRFFRHERKSYNMLKDIGPRLGFHDKLIEALQFSALNHMKFHLLTKMSNKKVVALMNDPNWEYLYNVAEADDRSRLSAFNEEKWNAKVEKIERLQEQFLSGEPKDEKPLQKIKRVVNGKLVMEVLNITTGPKIGRVIKKTINWIVDNNIVIDDIDKIREFILSQK